ncbi:beta subunit of 3-methylcrotonyl-CoA carboxylase [Aureobasidium subglaciale]|nr:beta subunit of 3-methylcrotonyl-CoA carboxylase [Aureobasidium subglaciale]
MSLNSNKFPIIASAVNRKDPQFVSNTKKWQPVLSRFEDALLTSASQGHDAGQARHLKRGQLLACNADQYLARDRVSLLLDPESPFLELCAVAGFDDEDSSPSASIVSGIGLVKYGCIGALVLIFAHIPTLSGAAWNERTVQKQNRVTRIATENKLPIIALVQSAGVFLPQQFKVFHAGGQIFRDLAMRTKEGCQSCAVVFGSSTAGGAYHPALSDYTIMVKDQAQVFLGGPPLVKMATGEVTDAETLGGAEMHASVTGLADQLATDEFDAIQKARRWALTLTNTSRVSLVSSLPESLPEPPLHDSEDILGIVNPDIRMPMDMMEILLRVVDGSRLELYKPNFGKALITAWAHIHGHLVGCIANKTPVIQMDESDKSTAFIHLCNQNNIPIIFFHNVTGFMVGTRTEKAGLIKRGARLVSAVSTSSVPHISIICGASYGAGNYAMCGRAYRPRFLFSWPMSRCSVMGAAQLSGVMETVQRASAKSTGKILDEGKLQAEVASFRDAVERDSEAYRTSSHLHDDGIIDPRDTRDVLGMCLEVVKQVPVEGSSSSRVLARI